MHHSYVKLLSTSLASVAVGAIAFSQSGCSAEAPEQGPDLASAPEDAAVASLAASAKTREALGVVTWQFFREGSAIDHVDGVDESGDVVLSISLHQETVVETKDGVTKEVRHAVLETSNGGFLRVSEDGTIVDSSPDAAGFGAIRDDVGPLLQSDPSLKQYDCSWLGTAICYATCAGCAFDPPACIMCALCVVDCFA